MNEERLRAHKEREALKEEINTYVINEGIKTAAAWGSGAAISLALHNKIGPANMVSFYNRRISLPYKVMLVAVVTTAAFFTRTDIAAMEADRAFALRYAVNREAFLKHLEEEKKANNHPFDLTKAGISSFVQKNKYLIVGSLWSSAVAGTLMYNFSRKDISTSQKLINARMTGQAAALLGVAAFGAASAMEPTENNTKVLDAHFESVINRKAN